MKFRATIAYLFRLAFLVVFGTLALIILRIRVLCELPGKIRRAFD